MSGDRWEPVDFHDIRQNDIILILTRAESDSPARDAVEALGEGWKPYLKVGATDRDTKLLRLVATEPEGGAE